MYVSGAFVRVFFSLVSLLSHRLGASVHSQNTLFAKHSTHNYLIFHIYCWCVTGDGTAQHKNAHVKRKTIMKNDARMFKTHKWYNMRFVTHKYMECNAFTCFFSLSYYFYFHFVFSPFEQSISLLHDFYAVMYH